MIAEQIDANIERIQSDLLSQGLTSTSLMEDILDHVCCMVEKEMIEGSDFESSYNRVISSIGDGTLKNVQHQTILMLDKKFQKMKNTNYVIGLSGSLMAIVGAFFKMQHWPGAGVLMLLGFFLVTAVFLPLYFVHSYREQAEKPQLIYPIIGYISLALILVGVIFKIQHWPGAGAILTSSIVVVVIGFVPLYLSRIFGKPGDKKLNIAYVVLLMIGISIITVSSRVNISKFAIDRMLELTVQNEESSQLLNNEIGKMIEITPDSLITPELKKLMDYSGELEMIADEMLHELMLSIKQEGVELNSVNHWDYRRSAKVAFINNGLAQKFINLSREYKDYLMNVVKDSIAKNQIEYNLGFTSEYWIIGWTPEDLIMEPMIICYQKITLLKRAVIYSEYLVVQALLEGG